jgi:hypothetical protein
MIENTLEDVKRSVRTKLGLAEDVSVRLVQLREGLTVELDDGAMLYSSLERQLLT